MIGIELPQYEMMQCYVCLYAQVKSQWRGKICGSKSSQTICMNFRSMICLNNNINLCHIIITRPGIQLYTTSCTGTCWLAIQQKYDHCKLYTSDKSITAAVPIGCHYSKQQQSTSLQLPYRIYSSYEIYYIATYVMHTHTHARTHTHTHTHMYIIQLSFAFVKIS